MAFTVMVSWLMLVISDSCRSGDRSIRIGMASWRDAIDLRFGRNNPGERRISDKTERRPNLHDRRPILLAYWSRSRWST